MPVKIEVVIRLLISVVLVVFVLGCDSEYRESEFFPDEVGLTWTYEITLGEVQPLYYYEKEWQTEDGKLAAFVRGTFLDSSYGKVKKQFMLVMQTKGNVANQGPLQYKNAVEVEILRDDLGVFRGAKQIFWAGYAGAVSQSMVNLVVTYGVERALVTGSMWGSAGQRESYALRLLAFFGAEPGTEVRRVFKKKNSYESLRFVGIDTNVAGYEGRELLHFIRSVKGSEEELSEIDAAFTEDMWYARGSGLVRVVQKVGAKVSMTWVLLRVGR